MPQMNPEIPIDKLKRLRHVLHRNAELSGKEKKTPQIIKNYFADFPPDKILENIGGRSLAVIFDSGEPGKTIVFRADLDALPIHESKEPEYYSRNTGVSHKCGHDGHMAILAGLSEIFSKYPPEKGKIVLLFQAEEETGTGAEKVVSDPEFIKLKPDYVFGLHNLPGFPKNTILIKKNNFAAASKGMIIDLNGRSSHAGHPENGNSPAVVISHLIQFTEKLNRDQLAFKDFTLVTIIHIKLGEKAFGTLPGNAQFMITLRAFKDPDIRKADEMIRKETARICEKENIKFTLNYTEEFPATVNHDEQVHLVEQAAMDIGADIQQIEETFRWSEDFGHYLKKFKGAFFGLGAGKNTPQLHNPEYDFPDNLIETGVKMYYQIYKRIITS